MFRGVIFFSMSHLLSGEASSKWLLPFPLIGAAIVLFWLIKCLLLIANIIYSCTTQFLELNVNWKALGEWAVITGGTDGIGKAYAEELACRGFNILLISRTNEKLISVASYIKNTYGVETETICINFSDDSEIYAKIKIILDNFNIGVLVNNVGMSYKYAEYFHALPNGRLLIEELIKANVVPCTMMMKIVLPQMQRKGKGVVINISSLTALYPMPLLSVYAASKAYVDYLTRAVQKEYKSKGIIIQSVLPAFVATKMSKIKRTSLEVPLPETFVHSAIKTVGIESYTYGYWSHKIRGFIHELLKLHMPTYINMAIALNAMKKIRRRYYQKSKQSER